MKKNKITPLETEFWLKEASKLDRDPNIYAKAWYDYYKKTSRAKKCKICDRYNYECRCNLFEFRNFIKDPKVYQGYLARYPQTEYLLKDTNI